MLLGGNVPGTDPKPTPAVDVLSQCYEADRATKVGLIREMATKEFPNPQAQVDWWNESVETARKSDFQPFIDAVSEAIVAEKLPELADQLEQK